LAHFGYVDAVAVGLVALPLADVLLPVFISPESVALHGPVFEVSHVVLVPEFEPSLTVSPVVFEVPEVDGSVGKFHVAFAHLVVKAELALIGGVLG